MSSAQLVLIELILIFGLAIWFGLSELRKLRDKRNSLDAAKKIDEDAARQQKPDR